MRAAVPEALSVGLPGGDPAACLARLRHHWALDTWRLLSNPSPSPSPKPKPQPAPKPKPGPTSKPEPDPNQVAQHALHLRGHATHPDVPRARRAQGAHEGALTLTVILTLTLTLTLNLPLTRCLGRSCATCGSLLSSRSSACASSCVPPRQAMRWRASHR